MASKSSSESLIESILIVWLLLDLAFAGNQRVATGNGESEVIRRDIVPLDRLPERFTDESLPAPSENNNKCFDLIGCYEQIPIIMAVPQDPKELKTKMQLFSREPNLDSVVAYEETESCLRDGSECDRYPYDLKKIVESPLRTNKRTIIIIGGYYSKAPSSWEMDVKDLWLQLDDVNVIIVAWTGGNRGIYFKAVANSRTVARQLSVFLYYWAKVNNLDLSDGSFTEKLYIVGHSLGAQIAGFVGQELNGGIGRITGLEPAGPSFDELDRRFRLDKSDARLVDTMRTNGGGAVLMESKYGSLLPAGHIDYYANDGRHQPGCSSDRFGCSHKKASNYYEAYLRHELGMRQYLGPEHARARYRLFAYASDSYDEFHKGSCLVKYCPITVLDDSDLNYEDLNNCSAPIDYVSWYNVVRNELESKHNVRFEVEANNPNYYFYTSAISNDQTDHYLIKIRVNKEAGRTNYRTDCDISLGIEMANGLGNAYKVKGYNLIDQGDHYEVIVPYLSPNTVAKYELAKLDLEDFYANSKNDSDQTELRNLLARVLPLSVQIGAGGKLDGEQKAKSGGRIMNFFRGLMDMARDVVKSGPSEQCSLKIDSFSVQPLRKMHRHLSAVYTADFGGSATSSGPNIVFLEANQTSPKLKLLDRSLDEIGSSAKLTLNTIIIGPRENEPEEEQKEKDEEEGEEIDEDQVRREFTELVTRSSNVSASTWLLLTISMCILIPMLIITTWITASCRGPRGSNDDEHELIEEQANGQEMIMSMISKLGIGLSNQSAIV